MNVAEAITRRMSIRGFKPDPVDQSLLNHIFETARWSASNCNIQSWLVNVVSGETKNRLAQALVAEVASGKEGYPDFHAGNLGLVGVHRDRQFECAARLYDTLGIERSDRQARNAQMLKNWQFFGAPHAAFISIPKYMKDGNMLDVGVYLQSLMLLMVENGLGSVAQGALSLYPGPAKEMLNIPEDYGIVVGLSFGYPDETAQVNKATMDRVPLESQVFFHA
ncbi:MAG TPA: nitroreductase [Pseudomonadales bacterium]|nr:nitroreductase [Pseudomonadales bacterium]